MGSLHIELSEPSLPSLVNTIETFDGDPDRFDWWVNQVEYILSMYIQSEVYIKILRHVRSKIRGSAHEVLVNANITHPEWFAIKSCLAQNFSKTYKATRISQDLQEMTQKCSVSRNTHLRNIQSSHRIPMPKSSSNKAEAQKVQTMSQFLPTPSYQSVQPNFFQPFHPSIRATLPQASDPSVPQRFSPKSVPSVPRKRRLVSESAVSSGSMQYPTAAGSGLLNNMVDRPVVWQYEVSANLPSTSLKFGKRRRAKSEPKDPGNVTPKM